MGVLVLGELVHCTDAMSANLSPPQARMTKLRVDLVGRAEPLPVPVYPTLTVLGYVLVMLMLGGVV